ncbi:MAG: PQQ-dependent sugar dehydrogenase, partial [Gemmataceae bacterium]|nr:PQQ-dependent sugar dehydrogenase [Gemmataceae bacterium]
EQGGRIVTVKGDEAREFLKLADRDSYAMCFHPRYDRNGLVYVFTNGPNSAKKKKNAILRFRAAGDPPRADPESQSLVIDWESNGHNGGDLGFGRDGMLYVTSGDGTSDSDGDATGQDVRDLCSGLLRLDVDGAPKGKGYAVPRDNPFLKTPGARPELWAFGLRNPWRMTIDRDTGDIYIGDVGQDQYEMVYLGKKGANYGWSIREGSHPFHPLQKKGPAEFVDPLLSHPHSESRSLTGGIVYRGKRFPKLAGTYLYGDYATGKVWGLRQKGGKIEWKVDLAATRLQIVAFAEMPDGEPVIVDHSGQLHTLEEAPPVKDPPRFPRKLSETGLFASVKGHVPHPGLIPYEVNSPLWSDGAEKERFIALPGEERIGFEEKGFWKFPERTALVKTFRFGERRVETRIMVLQSGEWAGYSYEWGKAQDEARLVEAGGKTVGGWRFPSRAECMMCHTRAANYVLGVCTSQLNRDGQLERFARMGLLSLPDASRTMAARSASLVGLLGRPTLALADDRLFRARDHPLPKLPEELPRLADPSDKTATLEARARSYLHANCAMCHVWAGGGNAAIDLHIDTPREKMRLVGVEPLHEKFGIKEAKLVAPGSPERSILHERLKRRGRGQMPPLASSKPDAAALELLSEWVKSLRPHPPAPSLRQGAFVP